MSSGYRFKTDTRDFTPGSATPPSFRAGDRRGNNSSLSSFANTPVSSTTSLTSLASMDRALDAISQSIVSPIIKKLKEAKNITEGKKAVAELAELITEQGPALLLSADVFDSLSALSKSKNSALTRELSAVAFLAILKKFPPPSHAEPYFLAGYTLPFELLSDKDINVKRAAQSLADTLFNQYCAEAKATVILPRLATYLNSGAKWQCKVAALKQLESIATSVPSDMLEHQVSHMMPTMINMMHDIKPEVSNTALKVTTAFCKASIDNGDVSSRMPLLIKALAEPTTVPNCIQQLSQVTFVAEVTEPVLALLVPTLERALNQSSSSQDLLRQTVTVVENLTRLVHDPKEVRSFIPILYPGVKKVVDTAALPYVRELAKKALDVLEDAKVSKDKEKIRPTVQDVEKQLIKDGGVGDEITTQFVACLVWIDIITAEWNSVKHNIIRYSYPQSKETVEKTADLVYDHFYELLKDPVLDVQTDEIEVVNTIFSLAYGGRMLLNKSAMRLFKGHRYGLCGRNGAGKSTLMRAIANGKLEGFPDKSQLRTCFVEHKLQGEEGDMSLVDFVANDPELQDVSRSEISDALAEVGFDEYRRSQNVGSLSGGWKMKLEIARAMILKADVLLLDEPTNHLDVTNVKWLEDYLTSHTEITSLIVSHDSGFLDAVCTDIIHYESKKLVYYKGNLSAFVEQHPEGKVYYTLSDTVLKLKFPPPGILSGVKSATRAIVRMSNVSFAYPGADKKSLDNVSCSLSLSSRVAVLGANGAGKSTLIKLLTGELVSEVGKVEKHPNLRIGYIAQHALAHVEQHLEKTPNQYIQWRYANGDDREVHLKKSRALTEEDRLMMSKRIPVGNDHGDERQVEAIVGRQKLKKSFRYEIKWKGFIPKFNSFVPREVLIDNGLKKLVQEFDDHEASREGLGYRELVPSVIRQHFEDVGLDGEIADHTRMGSLSGGQLVKVVIAGAMWNNPHLLVLDEPTNYLDREALGGLAVAIRDWSGSVVMISHNEEFVGALCPEQWIVQDGKLTQKGKAAVDSSRFEDSIGTETPETGSGASTPSQGTQEEDSMTFKTKKPKKKKLTRNQIKERDARRRLRYLEWLNTPKGTPRTPDTDDEDE